MSIGGTQAMGGGASGNGERPDVVKPVTLWSGMTAVRALGKCPSSLICHGTMVSFE